MNQTYYMHLCETWPREFGWLVFRTVCGMRRCGQVFVIFGGLVLTATLGMRLAGPCLVRGLGSDLALRYETRPRFPYSPCTTSDGLGTARVQYVELTHVNIMRLFYFTREGRALYQDTVDPGFVALPRSEGLNSLARCFPEHTRWRMTVTYYSCAFYQPLLGLWSVLTAVWQVFDTETPSTILRRAVDELPPLRLEKDPQPTHWQNGKTIELSQKWTIFL